MKTVDVNMEEVIVMMMKMKMMRKRKVVEVIVMDMGKEIIMIEMKMKRTKIWTIHGHKVKALGETVKVMVEITKERVMATTTKNSMGKAITMAIKIRLMFMDKTMVI